MIVELDILTDEPLQHHEDSRNNLIQIQHFGCDCLLAGKGQQLPCEGGGSFCRIEDSLQIGMVRVTRISIHKSQLSITEDDSQQIIKVVCHTSSQSADGFHLLRLMELLFKHGLFHCDLLAQQSCSDVRGNPFKDFNQVEGETSCAAVIELEQTGYPAFVANGHQGNGGIFFMNAFVAGGKAGDPRQAVCPAGEMNRLSRSFHLG